MLHWELIVRFGHAIGIGVGKMPSITASWTSPTNSVAPSITGTPTQNQSLSRSSYGTWNNGVSGYARQWFSNTVNSTVGGTAISGETGDTYLQSSAVVGDYIYLRVIATNPGGSTTAYSNIIGPVASSGGLATPTLTNVSTLGTAPVTLEMSTTDYVAGLRGQLQIATDSGFTSISQNIVFFIDGDSWARLDESIGLIDPSGTYYARVRILRDNESGSTSVTDQNGVTANYDASSWSTTFTDTIGGSVAVLTSTTGTSKSKYVNVATPFYQVVANAVVGAFDSSRASIHAANTKFHMEVTCNTFQATGGNSKIFVSCDDGTTDLNAGGTGFISTFPGNASGPNGFSVQLNKGGTTFNMYRNGGSQAITVPTAITDGDTIAFDIDTTAHTILMTWYHSGTATVLNSGTAITLTSQIPTNWYAIIGAGAGNGTVATGSSDAATFNPGNATNLVTPQTGFGIYG